MLVDSPQTPAGLPVETLMPDRRTLDEVAVVATEAFADDPFFSFLSPNVNLRRRGLAIYW